MMPRIFKPNIDRTGRLVRGLGAAVLLAGGVLALLYSRWLGAVLLLAGGFVLFEALRGWCVLRACGIKTRM